MKLKSINLKNIRTFKDEKIDLGTGTISATGDNGSGKTTIIESIGHALFGYDPEYRRGESIKLPNGQEYSPNVRNMFLRKGTKTGEIHINFEDDMGGDFLVVNKITSTAQEWEIYRNGMIKDQDPGKQGILNEVRNVLNIKDSYRGTLENYFSHIVTVLQGEIVDPFLKSQQKRKDYFDEILGISYYRDAERDFVHVKNYFSEILQSLREDIKELTGAVESLPEKRKNLQKRKKEIKNLQNKVDSLEDILEDLTKRKKKLDGLEKEINDLEKEKEKIITKINALQKQLEKAKERRNECEEARNLANKLKKDAKNYEKLEKELENIQTLLDKKNKLENKLGESKTQLREWECRADELK
ncbi:hypothetical protein AKJ66_03995, partial [candidate division MSBL1 archaeon SCGC-AAA259E22]